MIIRSLIVAGMAAVLGAVMGLFVPLELKSVDRGGSPIPCGNGLRPEYSVAREQDQLNFEQHAIRGPTFLSSDYAEQCAALSTLRRSVVAPVAAVGAVSTLAAIAVWIHMARRRDWPPDVVGADQP
ncbi:hypothetical protein [Mycolicibacterium mucogenicum]|nr:hypothetical protein [Mycolicibacterium mucogenicum]